jgi:hypothetical protein
MGRPAGFRLISEQHKRAFRQEMRGMAPAVISLLFVGTLLLFALS